MRWLFGYLFKWSGEVFVAFRQAFVKVECPYCHKAFKHTEPAVHAAFCDRLRAENLSETPVVSVLLDAPEIAPTVWQREPQVKKSA